MYVRQYVTTTIVRTNMCTIEHTLEVAIHLVMHMPVVLTFVSDYSIYGNTITLLYYKPVFGYIVIRGTLCYDITVALQNYSI